MASYITLNQNNEFRRVYGRGKSFVSPLVVVYVNRNRLRVTRYGITVSKKVGNAVRRNRAKRVINAALLENIGSIRPGFDIVFVARGRTAEVKSSEVARIMKTLLKRAGAL